MSPLMARALPGFALGAMTVSLGQAACGQATCDLAVVTSPVISVIDAKTKRPICDAKILVTSVDWYKSSSGPAVESQASLVADAGVDGSAPLDVVDGGDGGPGTCTYASELASGVWTLQVSHPGYAPETVSNGYVVVNACSPSQGQKVVVLLDPTGS